MGQMIENYLAVEAPSGLRLVGAIPTEVDFGNPRSKDCLNFGICRINFFNGKSFNLLPSCCPNRAYGFIRLNGQCRVELVFPKGNMAPATLEKHFGSGWFTVEEACHLPKQMADELGLSSFTFQPGRFPIWEENETLHVYFPQK